MFIIKHPIRYLIYKSRFPLCLRSIQTYGFLSYESVGLIVTRMINDMHFIYLQYSATMKTLSQILSIIYVTFVPKLHQCTVNDSSPLIKLIFCRAWCKNGDQDSGTRDLGALGPWTPLKFKSGTPGPPSKFKSGIPGPPAKFKSRTPLPFFDEFIFFQNISSLFYLFISASFLNKIQKNMNCE